MPNLQILKSGDILNRILSIDINALIKVANKSFWCDTKILKKTKLNNTYIKSW